MRKTIKKGFTLVELLITIAIIAILSVVAIVGYVSFTTKARISNDTTIVTELNRVLQAEHVNKTPNTMQEIVDEIKDAGFILTRLTPTASKHHIVYDKESDRFYLVNDQMTIVGGERDGKSLNNKTWYHWKVVQSYNDVSNPNFSYYLGEMKDDEPIEGITVCNGIDVGENEVKKIKYENTTPVKDDVVIRTNGGTLEIDTPDDTIKHYGEVSVLNITEVGKSSYHEYGYVPFAQIKAGRVINEVYVKDEAGIQNLFLIAKDSSSFDEIVVGAAPGKSLPTLDRTEVTIGDGVKVCEVQTGVTSSSTASNEFIWLFGDGTIESQKVVVTTSTSKPDVETGEVSEETSSGKAAIELANVSGEEKAKPADVETGIILYDGGAGTEKSPYLISEGSQFKNITNELADKNFTLINDIEVAESDFTEKYLINEFSGTLDGGNNRVKLPNFVPTDANDYRCLINNLSGLISNLEVEFNNFGYIVNRTDSDVIFNNVDVYGEIGADINLRSNLTNYGSYLAVDNAPLVTFNNCNFYGSIVAGGSKDNNNAIYVGQTITVKDDNDNFVERALSFNNCHNYGSIISGDATMFIANVVKHNQNSGINAYAKIDINNCTNEGLVQWIENTGYRPYNHFVSTSIHMVKEISINGIKYIKTIEITDAEQIAALNIDGTNVKEMEQEKATNGVDLIKHISPTMPDSNGRNYVVAKSDSTLKIYALDNLSFKVTKASNENVDHYEITNTTMVHYNGSSMLYTLTERILNNQFDGDTYTSVMKNYTFIDDKLIEKYSNLQGGVFGVLTIDNVDIPTYTVNNETHYYYHDDNFYFAGDLYKNKPGSVYVSAYDADGLLIASAPLTDAPATQIRNLVSEAKNGLNLDQLYIDSVDTADGTADGWRNQYYASSSNGGTGYDNKPTSGYSDLYVTGFIEIQKDSENNPIYIYYLKTKKDYFNGAKNEDRVLVATATSTSNNITKVSNVLQFKFTDASTQSKVTRT